MKKWFLKNEERFDSLLIKLMGLTLGGGFIDATLPPDAFNRVMSLDTKTSLLNTLIVLYAILNLMYLFISETNRR